MSGDPYAGRPVDVKDLEGYLRWALEHVHNATLVAEELKQPKGVQADIRLAGDRLRKAMNGIEEGDTDGEGPE